MEDYIYILAFGMLAGIAAAFFVNLRRFAPVMYRQLDGHMAEKKLEIRDATGATVSLAEVFDGLGWPNHKKANRPFLVLVILLSLAMGGAAVFAVIRTLP